MLTGDDMVGKVTVAPLLVALQRDVFTGIAESARNCLASHRPLRAVENTSAIATPSSDEAA
ncbi:hypothetical protein GCM10009811_09580 [Nostocoides veronense]|uniref:Uncharacterized protein n=1 Tax=Nostocoides veronense TaxID=330836 RepID=A0ABN2LFR1_9MICO